MSKISPQATRVNEFKGRTDIKDKKPNKSLHNCFEHFVFPNIPTHCHEIMAPIQSKTKIK
jgi:hypothetical protein